MLHEAARKENKEKFQRLVSKLGKASVHVKERDYEQTPLHCACDSGNTEVATLLLDKYKVEVNVVDKNGWTPLHSACNAGKLAIVDMLLSKGAFARALTNEGTSPLHYFVRHNYPATEVVNAYKIFQTMLSKGADVNCQNKHGDSPLHQASQRGREQNVLFLLNNKANPNLANKQGDTPLHTTIRIGQVAVAKMLVSMGQADVNLRVPPATQSPLELAQQIAPELGKDLQNILKEREDKEKQSAESKQMLSSSVAAKPGEKTPTKTPLVRAVTLSSVTSSMNPADRLSLRGKDAKNDIEREKSSNDVGSDRSAGSDRGSQERLMTNLPGPARASRDLTSVIGVSPVTSTSGLATSVTSSEDVRRQRSPASTAVGTRLSATVSNSSATSTSSPTENASTSDLGGGSDSGPGSTIGANKGDTSGTSPAVSSPVSITISTTGPSGTASTTPTANSAISTSGSTSTLGAGTPSGHLGHRKGSPSMSGITTATSSTTNTTSSNTSTSNNAKEPISNAASTAEEEQQPIACVNCAKDYSSVQEDLLVAQQVHFHTKAPYYWDTLGGVAEQKQRGRLSYDLCVIDNEQFFIKGLLELKIISDAPFNPYSRTPPQMLVFGIWVKVSREFFQHVVANWNTAYRDKDPKSKSLGELASVLPSYPDTLNLQVLVHTRERGKRFLVEVQPADHPLSFEQDTGVPPHRIKELIRYLRKPSLLQQPM